MAILTAEARMLIKRTKPMIITVTGSVGKTSTKDAIYATIKGKLPARKSQKSYNSEIGIPLTVLGLSNAWNNPIFWLKNIIDGFFTALFPGDYPKVLVIEAGVDRPGDMKNLTSWLKPDVVVLTRLPDVPVHVEYFKMPEDVVEEKMQLVYALKPEGVLVYNHDDTIIRDQLENVRHRSIGYSRYSDSQFRMSNDSFLYQDDMISGLQFDVSSFEENANVKVRGMAGDHVLYSCGAALATASLLEVSLEQAAKELSGLEPTPGRMRILPGIKHTTIIDDTYNSSPVAVESALATMREVHGVKRKILVLGDMLELGQYSVREHERMGYLAAGSADILFTLGVRSRKIVEGALENGMDEEKIFQYEDVKRAGRELQAMIEPGDIILVKASQGIRAERIVEEIMYEPERAEELLVRQGRAWQNKPDILA